GALYLRRGSDRPDRVWLRQLTCVAALGAVDRLDSLLLLAPALAWAAWEVARARAVAEGRAWRGYRASAASLVVGMAPLGLWLLYALLFYGFPLPITPYAQLAHGVPAGERAG